MEYGDIVDWKSPWLKRLVFGFKLTHDFTLKLNDDAE